MIAIQPNIKIKREAGYSNFKWLRTQALDHATLQVIDLIEKDEQAFIDYGVIAQSNEEYVLRLRQGTFITKRSTSHTIANIFVQIYEKREHAELENFLSSNIKTVLDVGANEGFYALNLARHNPGVKIIAVEPNPVATELLQRNVDLNHFAKNVALVKGALWSKSGVIDFNLLPQVTSIGSLVVTETSFLKEAKERIVKIPVRAYTLEELFENYELDKVDILKMDIEGAEYEVLKNSSHVLSRIDRIVLEYHTQQLRHLITSFLTAQNFDLVRHAPDRLDFGDLYFVKKT